MLGTTDPAVIQHRDINVDGITYSVPQAIQRVHAKAGSLSNLGGWLVLIKGRRFSFRDKRSDESPIDSLKRAGAFFRTWYNTEPSSIPTPRRAESNIKNVEYGLSGIQSEWYQTVNGTWNLTIRLIVERNYLPVSFSKSIKSSDFSERAVANVAGLLGYMQHICKENPTLSNEDLRTIWRRIVAGNNKSLHLALPDQTMAQLADNLEMRKMMASGKGFDNPYNNQYVR